VSSTRASEGKSSSALALAQNYARRGARVLLIDSDLRRPAFRTESREFGLTKLLTNDEPIDGHVLTTQHESMWLLPCGPIPPNPADLLSTPRFKQILADAASKYDMVIVDGPPALGLADATFLASACRNVMLVIESGKTRTRAAREAAERIQETGAQIVGVTLSKAPEERSTYGYGVYGYGKQIGNQPRTQIMIAQPADAS
jgi:polysaccharide biosynthesis transport protein